MLTNSLVFLLVWLNNFRRVWFRILDSFVRLFLQISSVSPVSWYKWISVLTFAWLLYFSLTKICYYCYFLLPKESEIQCQIQNGSAGLFPVAVLIGDVGFAQSIEGELFHFMYQSEISHLWPASGSLAGNTCSK